MPCTSQPNMTPSARQLQQAALARLDSAIARGSVRVVIGREGAIAFRGWQDREGISDLCAYRALAASNSPSLRRAIARAEAISGNKLNARAIASGTHSHDGGATFHPHD